MRMERKPKRTADERRFTQIVLASIAFIQKIFTPDFLDGAQLFFKSEFLGDYRATLKISQNFPDLNGAIQSYLRKSASICGSFSSSGLIRINSCPFVVLFRSFAVNLSLISDPEHLAGHHLGNSERRGSEKRKKPVSIATRDWFGSRSRLH